MPELIRKDQVHPISGAIEQGYKLSLSGGRDSGPDIFQLGDLVALQNGRWEPISRALFGQPISASDKNSYIRPASWSTS
jgi:hypothetical protein